VPDLSVVRKKQRHGTLPHKEEPLTFPVVCNVVNAQGGIGMRFIPTRLHGLIDYVVGLIVIGLPYFLGFGDIHQLVLIVLGVAVLLYSLLTDYEFAVIRFLRIRFHLMLDGLFGMAMLASPWLFDFPPDRRWPLYVIGVFAVVLSMTTQIRAEGTAGTN